MEKNLTFESALENLESIVHELESGSTELDKAIEKYTEAMKLVKFCNDKLNSATDKVNKILTDNGQLVDFDIEE
jgi:exodeoxyribonuclease VII small subunit